MDFFEKMKPTEREIALLEIVQGSILIEGMIEAAEELEQRITELKKKQSLAGNPELRLKQPT